MSSLGRVAVALSGGIDSAVTAKLLIDQGYDVVGITGKMTCSQDSDTVIFNAQKVAENLGIKHYVVDVTVDFEEKVIKYFENSYKTGLTPNPCIMCNKYIKWGKLFDFATNVLNADYIATGHYANIRKENGFFKLYPAADEHKDQLYFLFSLSQDHLVKTIFPLANYSKYEVKKLAEKYDLPSKSAKESQDICFIKPPMTTKKYLNGIISSKSGLFIEKSSGKVLGMHNGFWQYTIGQRKGIGIAAPEPLYVIEIDPDKNIVYVGYKDQLLTSEILLENIEWSYPVEIDRLDVNVKIRYNMNFVKANIVRLDSFWKLSFLEPVSGVTRGQACVIYDISDGHLLGGAFI